MHRTVNWNVSFFHRVFPHIGERQAEFIVVDKRAAKWKWTRFPIAFQNSLVFEIFGAAQRFTEEREVTPGLEKMNMKGIVLILAGLFETGWAIGLKYTEGFTRLRPTLWTILAMGISLWLLGIAMKTLPVGTTYSVWVGVGAVGTVILGIILFGEPANTGRLISVAFTIAGIIGLKFTTTT